MSVPFSLSSEQEAIVNASQERLSVVASAGAGKTLVLVRRYLRHVLEEGIDPSAILTITFTRKAAAEMKSRIVDGLREAGAWDQALSAETGPIQTIHSLCEQLLREGAFEAGVDAQFEILSEAQSGQLQTEAVEETLATVDPSYKDAEDLIAKLAGRRSYANPNSPYSRLRASIQDALRLLRDTSHSREALRQIYSGAEAFNLSWRGALLETQPGSVRELAGEADASDWREALQRAYKLAKRPMPGWLRHLPDLQDDERSNRETCGIVQFALEAWDILESRMAKRQEFDFSYLEQRTLHMFTENPELAARMANRFEVLMVDEAQDLNPKQHALIDLLGGNRRLTVGDDRQSIYGFRLADPDLFRSQYRLGAMRLSRNYRSQPGVLNFVDHVFSSIWKESYEPMQPPVPLDLEDMSEPDFSGVEIWEMETSGPASCAPYIRDLIAEGVEAGEICVLARNGAACQQVHEALGELGIASRIHGGSEKFYTRMEVRDLANILRCLADPYNDFSLLSTLRGPAVEMSLEGVCALAAQKPVLDALRTVKLSVIDSTKLAQFIEWYEPMKSYADRVSAWEILGRVFAETPFLEALARHENGLRQIANVRKLLTLAANEHRLGALEFADQIRDTQEIRHKEGDADEFRDASYAVAIMTIHKAKGLEFPVVVLPETNRKLGSNSSEILMDSEIGLLAVHFGEAPGLFYKFLSERKKEREIAEELRVLYVAITRARQRLCIGLYPPSSGDTVTRRIRTCVRDPFPSSIKVRKRVADPA